MNIGLEIIGYLGTALVLVSMMMTKVNLLRVFNMAGSVFSLVYSLYHSVYAVVFLNAGLILINFFQLLRAYIKTKKAGDSLTL